jgi:hypothetical protein
MASVILNGDTSGSVTLSAPSVAGSTTQTLVAETGTLAPIVSGTAQASTSGTSIDFTGIPSWVKRITVMVREISTNGISPYQIQLGTSGVPVTSGYFSSCGWAGGTTNTPSTTGLIIQANPTATSTSSGSIIITKLNLNIWCSQGIITQTSTNTVPTSAGSVDVGGVLDMIRITTVGGANTFDAGSINILYE